MGASKGSAASFLSATTSKDGQAILNLHLQESSDAVDKHAMAASTLLQEKKLLALEERAAAEKEFLANAVSSLANELKASKGTAASFLSATTSKDGQPILNLHLQESSDAVDKHAMAASTLLQEKKLLALEEHAAAEKEFLANA